jgi:hypothetical protein
VIVGGDVFADADEVADGFAFGKRTVVMVSAVGSASAFAVGIAVGVADEKRIIVRVVAFGLAMS